MAFRSNELSDHSQENDRSSDFPMSDKTVDSVVIATNFSRIIKRLPWIEFEPSAVGKQTGEKSKNS